MNKMLNNYLVVRFHSDHNKVFRIGNLELIRPDSWRDRDENGMETDKWGYNTNMREVHPHIATVIVPNENFPFKKGDRVFLHYMAKETEEPIEVDGDVYSAVGANFVFFTIKDAPIMCDNIYLGEQLYIDAPTTPSGIYITPFDRVKEVLKIRITHIPEWVSTTVYGETFKRKTEIRVGDVVCTCDDFQYPLEYEGKEYVKLLHDEIVAKFEEA